MEAGLWSAGNNWTKFKRRMLMWRAVGFLTKDLFSDVLGNFPIAEELLFRGTPEDDIDRIPARAISQLSGAVDAPASDALLDELAPRVVTDSAPEAEGTGKTVETDPAPPADPKAEGRFRNLLASYDEASDVGELEVAQSKALKAACGRKDWEKEAEDKFMAIRTTRFGNVKD